MVPASPRLTPIQIDLNAESEEMEENTNLQQPATLPKFVDICLKRFR